MSRALSVLAEVKGSNMKIRPKHIILTSNFKIEQVWAGSVFTALWRRFIRYILIGVTPLEKETYVIVP